jgi:DNA-binding response OmpR family regulator
VAVTCKVTFPPTIAYARTSPAEVEVPAEAGAEAEAEAEALADGAWPAGFAGRYVVLGSGCAGAVFPALSVALALGGRSAFPACGIAAGCFAEVGVAEGEDVTDGVSTAALSTGMPGSTPAFLITTFAPSKATQTAMTVPAIQAARPSKSLTIWTIMPQLSPWVRNVRIMARVLIVEDDSYVRSAMVAELTRRSHAVRTAGTALDGIREVSNHPPEVIVLDLGLPDLDGSQALKMMRTITTAPVIVATARDEEAEIIRLLNDGADDYVVKPFSGEHLAARITALLRRASQGNAPTSVVAVAGLSIDSARREALLDGRRLELSRREFDLLAYLAARPGTVVSRRELLTEVWHQSYGDDQTIDVHISWLRRKLGETAARPRYLHTVRGVGVMLDAPRF